MAWVDAVGTAQRIESALALSDADAFVLTSELVAGTGFTRTELRELITSRPPHPDGFDLTVHQAGVLLHLSRPRLVRLMNRGEIGYVRSGHRRTIPLSAVLEYRRRNIPAQTR
jgi:excisionase family DNA binding protein